MIKTLVGIDGMMCDMCEAHMNDLFRNHFDIKKVKSSHKKGEGVVISEKPLDENQIREETSKIGYRVTNISSEPYQKKSGFFAKIFG